MNIAWCPALPGNAFAAVAASICVRFSRTISSLSAVTLRFSFISKANAASNSRDISESAFPQILHAAGVHWLGLRPVLLSFAAASTLANVVPLPLPNVSQFPSKVPHHIEPGNGIATLRQRFRNEEGFGDPPLLFPHPSNLDG
jgi:hypothetical protein